MFVKWADRHRISFVPLIIGIVFGLCVGRWWMFKEDVPKFDDPKITCLVLQRSISYLKINVSKETWLQKCHNYIIVKPIKTKRSLHLQLKVEGNCEVPVDVLTLTVDSGWSALCRAFQYLPQTLEWLIIVPESSFVIIENLKDYVRGLDWKEPKYLGHAVKNYIGDYNMLSAGIVLSNGAVTRLLKKFNSNISCDSSGKYWNNEDIYLGSHLQKLGVQVEDTRDSDGGGRFHGFNLNTLLFPGRIFKNTNYFKKATFPIAKGFRCCSRNMITIDTSDADHALFINFLLYGIKFNKKIEKPNITFHVDEPSWVKSLREIGYTGPTDGITAEQYYDIWAKHIPPERLSQKFAEAVAP